MVDRPCKECIWHTEDGCSSWDCDPVTRKEAREKLKKLKEMEEEEKDNG